MFYDVSFLYYTHWFYLKGMRGVGVVGAYIYICTFFVYTQRIHLTEMLLATKLSTAGYKWRPISSQTRTAQTGDFGLIRLAEIVFEMPCHLRLFLFKFIFLSLYFYRYWTCFVVWRLSLPIYLLSLLTRSHI